VPERSPLPAPVPAPRLYGLAWIFYLLLGVSAVVWIGMRRGRIDGTLFLDPARWWIDLVLGAGCGALLLGLWELVGRRLDAGRRFEALLRSVLGTLDASQAVGLALLSGFAEELFFRGAMQDAWGYGWATVLFALLHTGRERGLWLWTAFALIAGAAFGALVLWTGNLLAAIVGHVVVNAVNLTRLTRRAEAHPA
jgi:membrane protease YdiL (CAAX protease family)